MVYEIILIVMVYKGMICGDDIWGYSGLIILAKANSSHLKLGLTKRQLIFQPSIFRGHVSFREGI